MIPHYDDMHVDAPDVDALESRFQELSGALADGEVEDALASWERVRRDVDTWATLTLCRFQQNTEDDDRRDARDRYNRIAADLQRIDVAFKRGLLESRNEEALAEHVSPYVFERFDAACASFDPSIAEEFTRELELRSTYTSLISGARLEHRGETWNLTRLEKLVSSPDRSEREAATRAIWDWFEAQRDELDQLFEELVTVRTRAGRILGHDTFTPLGYERMSRIGYDADDVASFRNEVLEYVVPLARELRARQAQRLGVERVMLWDERVHGTDEDPAPPQTFDEMLDAVGRTFAQTHPDIADFFSLLRDRGLVDLEARDGKAGGGFCAYLPRYGVSFIFGNFNGSRHGVRTIVHEVGHAFQKHCCRDKPFLELMRPTLEACEIHSMALEYLVWPGLDEVFGASADRYRELHLTESILFLPYGVAVDHFQHLIYANPDATPDERASMWRDMEARYLPDRSYGGMPSPESGRFWQRQRHIYMSPFYYIDYTLALTCALQLWVRSQNDHAAAMRDYLELCRLGGEASFEDLATSVGLRSPFRPGCLQEVVTEARSTLGL